MSQPSLFDNGHDDERRLESVHAEARDLATRLPTGLRFGTSSWSFPGWAGIVYSRRTSQAELAREGLREYATHPLLTTVGIDRGYYAPIPESDLVRYASQLPRGFPCCTKAPSTITSAVLFGKGRTAEPNPDFLNADRFVEDVLGPFGRAFRSHSGPFIFECAPTPRGVGMDAAFFAEALDRMFDRLPSDFTYAVELRDRLLLTPAYRDVLARHGVAHTYNYWTAMPMPGAQARIVPLDTAPFLVVRLLLRPGTAYEDRRDEFRPFDELRAPDAAMRNEVVDLVLAASARGRGVFVLVNNKAEGSAPLTIRELARRVASR